MLQLNDITLDKKEYLNRFLHRGKSRNSEFSFAYLYTWRKSYDVKYAVFDDMLCILPKHYGVSRCASFPLGYENPDGSFRDTKPFIEEIIKYFKSVGEEPIIHLYDENSMKLLVKEFPDRFIITENRNNFDYVYKTEDLINLSGKRYHSKKNHINKFKRLYPDWEYCKLTAKDRDECLALFDRWQDGKDLDPESIAEEREALCEFLETPDLLGCSGGGLRVDGRLAAFSFGEQLGQDTALIHFEHISPEYDGAFPMINQQFLTNEWNNLTYVNREEDMGIPGMRKAKESYHPIFMIKKYAATLK